MNEKQKNVQKNDDAEFATEDSAPKKKVLLSKSIRWTAIVVVIIALVSVYITFDDWNPFNGSSELDNLTSIENINQQEEPPSSTLESQDNQINVPDYSLEIDALQKNLEGRLRQLNSLPSRMSTIEDRVSSLVGISAGAREVFLLSEAEYYLQIANAQLQLANNPRLSSLALQLASERITQISNPDLDDVQDAISDELAMLDAMKTTDLEGITLTLASLAQVVESLPLAIKKLADEIDEEVGPEKSNVDRAWNSVKSAMSGLVKVTPPDAEKLTPITSNTESLLRNNIALQLQSARLALLRGEQIIFEQTLNDISTLLDTFFDTDSEQVNGVKATISEIKTTVFTPSVPDISGSLHLLRQFQTLREASK